MMVRIVLNHAYNKFAPNKKCIQYNSQFFVTCRAELGALKTLSSGRLPRFLFAAIESFIWRNKEDHAPQCGLELYGWGSLHPVPPSATIGGLRTVMRSQIYGPDCPQPSPTAGINLTVPIVFFVRTRGVPELYGWGSLHPLPSAG